MSDATDQVQASADQAVAAQTRQVLAFLLNQEEYAVPIEDVKEVIKIPQITSVPGGREFISGIINLRGKIIPVLDIEKLFSLQRDSQTPTSHLLIVEDAHKELFGIKVDEVEEVLKIAPDAIKPPPKMVASKISAEYLEGVIILEAAQGDNSPERVLLLINMQMIVTDKIIESLKEVVNL